MLLFKGELHELNCEDIYNWVSNKIGAYSANLVLKVSGYLLTNDLFFT